MNDQEKYGNDFERAVIGKHTSIDPQEYAREITRYQFAAQFIKPGMSVLELGCSSGYGNRFFEKDIDYTGVDYGKEIVKYARKHFGDAKHKFVCSTIDKFMLTIGHYDVILALEVLEHIYNGKEVAQQLKQHCDTLVITAPYREPVGFWGKHHLLHGLDEGDFPEFDYQYIHLDGSLEPHPTNESANLMAMVWEKGKVYEHRERILCAIPTKNRYDALMLCLAAVAFQTRKPDKVVIYDDGDHLDLREHPQGRHIFPLLDKQGIKWEVIFTLGLGQHIAHQIANTAGYDYVWRLDDDNLPEPDVLERLMAHMASDVGAVGGAVFEPQPARQPKGGTSKLEDFFGGGNCQWAPDQGLFEDVDFLYSSFVYRAGIVNYKAKMSPVAFHEETIFTHRLKLAGWKLIADTSIHTYHFKSPHGGTRSQDYKWAYELDHKEFMEIMEKEWGIKLIHLGVGLGDNLVFLNILPELKKKYKMVILGSCYPEVFEGQGVKIIPYDAAKASSDENIYNWMAERNWQGHILDAYRRMYDLDSPICQGHEERQTQPQDLSILEGVDKSNGKGKHSADRGGRGNPAGARLPQRLAPQRNSRTVKGV